MPAEPHIVSVTRDSKFQISYGLSDGSGSAFRCTPEFGDFVVEAWSIRNSRSQLTIEAILDEVQELHRIVKEMR